MEQESEGNTALEATANKITVGTLNVRSIRSKLHAIKAVLTNFCIDVLVVTKTHHEESEYFIAGYQHLKTPPSKIGGIIIYARELLTIRLQSIFHYS